MAHNPKKRQTRPGTIPQPHNDHEPPTGPRPERYAFRMPCPECNTAVPWPFDPIQSAMLDRLCVLEEALEHDVHRHMEALHLHLSCLEDAILALQGRGEEVRE